MKEYIDIGVNLTNKSLMQNLDDVLERAESVGVKQLVVTGTDLGESRQAITLCESNANRLVCTAGLHPHHASDWQDGYYDALEQLAKNPVVRAIGETGLDFNRDFSPRAQQLNVFQQQLELACETGKPVFAHQRDAHDAFMTILGDYRGRLSNIVVHCFTDNKEALKDYIELDCHIGITGWICDERRGTELQQLVKLIPDNRMMIETDAPYLLPRDLKPKPKSRINEPAYLPHIAERIAYYQHKPVDQLAKECLETTKLFFTL